METEEISIKKFNVLTNRNSTNNFRNFVFLCILIGLFYFYNFNYLLFHSLAEIYSCIIASGILMFSLSTYNMTKNSYFLFLGIGYMCFTILDIFHAFTYEGIILSEHFVYDIDTKLWVAARILEVLTHLTSFVLLYKPHKKFNYYFVFLFFFILVLFIYIDIFHLNIFIPEMRIEGVGLTKTKISLEYLIASGFLLCCIILYFERNKIDKSLFVFLEISLICKVISEIFFTMYFSVTDFYNMMGHMFKVVSYYFLYVGIIVNGLQRPYDMIKTHLDNADKEIEEKEKLRKYMEEIINQNEQCYDWIIDNSSNGIIMVKDKKIVIANKTAINLLGAKDISDVKGKYTKEFLLDSSIEIHKLKSNINSSKFNELKLLRINKETIDVEYSINNITYRGTPAYLVFLRDLKLKKEINDLKNDLKENEIELNKSNEFNKVLTEFFSNISHDLKTPINVILSAVQLLTLKKDVSNPDDFMEQLNRMLGIIKQNCYRLIRLVSNLIDTSKYESGFLKLELKNHNIVSIVEDITMSVGDYIRLKGVNIIFDTDVEERIIAVDADKIERIILNLLSNAVKFTDKGDEILVYIEDRENYVSISVKDTGVGIPDDKLKIIFDRFGQVDKTLIRNKEGSGIGLSLVKTLTEMHGGNIKVKSKLGEGSEFIIELPVRLIENGGFESSAFNTSDNKIDKVLIEFSDIYSID